VFDTPNSLPKIQAALCRWCTRWRRCSNKATATKPQQQSHSNEATLPGVLLSCGSSH
jgi:hypothetical protein